MVVPVITFKQAPEDNAFLPAWCGQGVVNVSWMLEEGILDQAGRDLRFPRVMGRYDFIDFVTILTFGISSRVHRALHSFFDDADPYLRKLAAVAGRDALPGQSAVSRFNRAVPLAAAQKAADNLLLGTFKGFSPEWRASCALRGRMGKEWQVMDFDYKHEGIRKRALPEGEDLPEPSRLGPESARPGYTGRHRGELAQNHGILIHRGSAQCLQVTVEAGNPSMAGGLASAAAAVKRVCARDGLPPEQVILAVDGEGHTRTCLEQLAASPLNFITRSCRYELLDDPGIQRMLNEGDWHRVRDSGSGPVRYAIDLGSIAVRVPVEGAPDGFREAHVRLALSRFKPQSANVGAGRTIGEYHYEIFASQLDRKAFGPGDIVWAYMSRASVENQYACGNRELNLGHLYCHKPGGQLLSLAVCLAVWNVSSILGSRAGGRDRPLPLQLEDSSTPERPEKPLFPGVAEEDGGTPKQDAAPAPDFSGMKGAARAQTFAASIDWSRQPRFKPGSEFTWDPERQVLGCKAGTALKAYTASPLDGKIMLRFQAPPGICAGCTLLKQ